MKGLMQWFYVGENEKFYIKSFYILFIFLHINSANKTLNIVLLNFCEKNMLGDMIKKEKFDIKRQVFIFSILV